MLPQEGSFVGSWMGHRSTKVCYYSFSLYYPNRAHLLGHGWGTAPRSMLLQFFNVLPQGGSFVRTRMGHRSTKVGYFNFSMCYPKGAHSLGHRLGQRSTKVGYFNFSMCTPRGLIRWVTVWGNAPQK